MPEFVQNLPVVMIPFAILAWLWNQNNLKWMQERREIAEAIIAERKEWMQERRDMLDRQFGLNERLITEMAQTRGENHALRNKLSDFMLRLETYFAGRTGGKDG